MYVDPQKARQERERQERERQARIKAEKERKAKIKAEEERKAKAERDRTARIKAEEERKAKLKAEQKDPDKKPTQAKKADPKLEAKKPSEPKTESQKPQAEKKPDDKSQTEITWSKPGQTNPIYGISAPIYEQPSVPIAQETQTESKPKKPDDRKARTWTGEKAEPIIAQPHQISEPDPQWPLPPRADLSGLKAKALAKKAAKQAAKEAAKEKQQQEQSYVSEPDPQWPLPPRADLSGLKAKALAKKAAKEEARQNQLQQEPETTAQRREANLATAPLFAFNPGTQVATSILTPGMLGTQVDPLLPQSNSALKVSSPKAPKHLAQNSFYQPPQPDLHRQIITRQPMNSAAELEAATIQQTYGFHNATFARWMVESRLQEEGRRTAWVREQLRPGGARTTLPLGHEVGHFESSTSLADPHQTSQGQFYYNVSLSANADRYYRYMLPKAKQVWIAEVGRRQNQQAQIAQQQAAQQQTERNQQIAQQVAQLQAVKAQQRLQATQAAATQSKLTNGAVGLPPISFNRQYVVPQSLLTNTAAPQKISQITPQTAIQPKTNGASGEPSAIEESKGPFDAKYAAKFYKDLYTQGNKEQNLLKLFGGTVGGGITNAYLGFTGLAEQGVKDSLELAHQGQSEGGLSGGFKTGLGYGLTFIPSQFTQERAPGSMIGLATVPLAAAATTKFGQAVLSNPVVQRAVLPAIEGAGALFSGKQLNDGITGKDLLTGEQLSEEERVSRTGQAGLGILGTGYLLKDKGKEIIQGARAIPGNVERLSQRLMGQTPELALPGGVRINSAEVELSQSMQMKGAAPQGEVTGMGGQLGVSTEAGSIKLGGNAAQPPKVRLNAESEVRVPKAPAKVEAAAPTTGQPAPKAEAPKAKTGVQKPETIRVTPQQAQRFEQVMQLSQGGDKVQAAQRLRELKAEVGAEQYQVLQRQYLASRQGSALRTTTQPEKAFSSSNSKLSSHPEEMLAGHLDLMLPNDGFSINAQHRKLLEGYYDVIAHGNPHKIRIDTVEPRLGIDHRTLAKILEHRPDYNGECIRMLSCSTGAMPDGFAQNLSNKMNKDVLAPSDLLWFGKKGESAISEMETIIDPVTGDKIQQPKIPYTGQWNKFEPGENIITK